MGASGNLNGIRALRYSGHVPVAQDDAGALGLPTANVDSIRSVLRDPHDGQVALLALSRDVTSVSNCSPQSLHLYS